MPGCGLNTVQLRTLRIFVYKHNRLNAVYNGAPFDILILILEYFKKRYIAFCRYAITFTEIIFIENQPVGPYYDNIMVHTKIINYVKQSIEIVFCQLTSEL